MVSKKEEVQWTLLVKPEVLRAVAKEKEKEELLSMAEQMEFENSLKQRPFRSLKGLVR